MAAACGGVKLFGTEYGEIKRMYVRPQFRGHGFAKAILNQLADYAQSQGVTLLRLEERDWTAVDSRRQELPAHQQLVPALALRAGELIEPRPSDVP